MPSYRLLHTNARTGRRTKQLTDLEYLVWLAYLLSADDYGVCPASPRKLQGDDPRLDTRPTKVIQKCINALVSVGLIAVFDDGGGQYLYQPDWQDWQRIRYPSASSYPAVPPECFARLSAKTRAIFEERSRNCCSESENRDGDLTTADANANANASVNFGESPRGVSSPLVMSPLRFAKLQESHAFIGSRLRIPNVLHDELRTKLGGDQPELVLAGWYAALDAEVEASREAIPDVFVWLRPKFVAWAKNTQADVDFERFRPKGA